MVLEHLGEARYRVRHTYDRERADARRAALEAYIVDLSNAISQAQLQLADLQAAVDDAHDALQTAIATFRAGGGEDTGPVVQAQSALAAAAAKRDAQRAVVDTLRWRRARAQIDLDALTRRMPDDPVLECWCADYSVDIAPGTEVGLIDWHGDPRVPTPLTAPVMQPGHEGAAGYDLARDGRLLPTPTMGLYEWLYAYLLMPGWQRWLPLYRLATITALDGDFAAVALDGAQTWSADGETLPINPGATLSGVPVRYMSCHGAAFAVGDRVVVRFRDRRWDRPEVVGFQANPRPCAAFFVTVFAVGLYAYARNGVERQILADPGTNDLNLLYSGRFAVDSRLRLHYVPDDPNGPSNQIITPTGPLQVHEFSTGNIQDIGIHGGEIYVLVATQDLGSYAIPGGLIGFWWQIRVFGENDHAFRRAWIVPFLSSQLAVEEGGVATLWRDPSGGSGSQDALILYSHAGSEIGRSSYLPFIHGIGCSRERVFAAVFNGDDTYEVKAYAWTGTYLQTVVGPSADFLNAVAAFPDGLVGVTNANQRTLNYHALDPDTAEYGTTLTVPLPPWIGLTAVPYTMTRG